MKNIIENNFKTIIAIAGVIISLSVAYALVLKPYQDNSLYRECIQEAERDAKERMYLAKTRLLDQGDVDGSLKLKLSDFDSSAKYSCYKRFKIN